jgi:hypothetical protein
MPKPVRFVPIHETSVGPFAPSAIARGHPPLKSHKNPKLNLAPLSADSILCMNEPSDQARLDAKEGHVETSKNFLLTLLWRFEKLALHTEHNRTK